MGTIKEIYRVELKRDTERYEHYIDFEGFSKGFFGEHGNVTHESVESKLRQHGFFQFNVDQPDDINLGFISRKLIREHFPNFSSVYDCLWYNPTTNVWIVIKNVSFIYRSWDINVADAKWRLGLVPKPTFSNGEVKNGSIYRIDRIKINESNKEDRLDGSIVGFIEDHNGQHGWCRPTDIMEHFWEEGLIVCDPEDPPSEISSIVDEILENHDDRHPRDIKLWYSPDHSLWFLMRPEYSVNLDEFTE